MGLGYILYFSSTSLVINRSTTYYDCGYIMDGFLVLDVEQCSYVYFYLTSSSRATCEDVNVWYAKLGHIRQDQMNRLAREDLLDSLIKVDLPIYELCLAGKQQQSLLVSV